MSDEKKTSLWNQYTEAEKAELDDAVAVIADSCFLQGGKVTGLEAKLLKGLHRPPVRSFCPFPGIGHPDGCTAASVLYFHLSFPLTVQGEIVKFPGPLADLVEEITIGKTDLFAVQRFSQSVDSMVRSVEQEFHVLQAGGGHIGFCHGRGFFPELVGGFLAHPRHVRVHGVQDPVIILSHPEDALFQRIAELNKLVSHLDYTEAKELATQIRDSL